VLQARRAAEPPGGRGDSVSKMRHRRPNGGPRRPRDRFMHWRARRRPFSHPQTNREGRTTLPGIRITCRIRFSAVARRRLQRCRAIQVMFAAQGFLVRRRISGRASGRPRSISDSVSGWARFPDGIRAARGGSRWKGEAAGAFAMQA
jgi:hypothetical protein